MKITNIKWETDGHKVDLPKEEILPFGVINCDCGDLYCENNCESINEYLSNKYGWLVRDYSIEKVK